MHLLTGFPGFIACQLVQQLFEKQIATHIYAVVHASDFQKATERAKCIQQTYPHCQIELFEGDITLPDLGLDMESIEKITEQTCVLWHLAAIYDLAVAREVAWRINVHGTTMVNDFARKLPKLTRYMYFSAAYIVGNRTGTMLETELVRPQAFKNYYEESKFEAELRVEDLKKELPITIVRPSIVCGHSKTGETCKFDGPYFFLNVIEALKRYPIPFVGSKTTTINIVPVDFVVAATAYLSTVQEAEGKTYHLTDPNPLKVEELFRLMMLQMIGKKPFGRVPFSLTKKCLESLKLRQRLGVEYEAIDYLNWNVSFDGRDAQQLLTRGHISCPPFTETLKAMIAFYKKNQHKTELFVAIK